MTATGGPHPGFEAARRVADAVLHEGYVLYPYRASSAKNHLRWQFGVLAPRGWCEAGGPEAWCARTEVLLRPGPGARVDVRLRALRLQARQVEEATGPGAGAYAPVASLVVDDRHLVTWDEGLEVTLDAPGLALADLEREAFRLPVALAGGGDEEVVRDRRGRAAARVVRRRWPVTGVVRAAAAPVGPGLVRLRLEVENLSPAPPGADRDEALRRSLVATHLLVGARAGRFLSLADPPPEAAPAAEACDNRGLWPVLAGADGADDVVLASPIILADHPAVAPESEAELCDATEIDEILTLRTMTLTDEEKAEARATDDAARAIVDAADTLPPAVLERLHGAIRSLRPVDDAAPSGAPGDWGPLGDTEADDPVGATVAIGGALVGRGWRVRLAPTRRADTMDLFLAGREARVTGVYRDPEGHAQLGVVVGDDGPDAGGDRPLFFHPDEVEVLGPPAAMEDGGPGARRVLVAGIGNIFLSDDGFGSEVARRLQTASLPEGVEVADVGIGGVHLAYDLLEAPAATILVDAVARGGPPGTLYVIEPDLEDPEAAPGPGGGAPDAHGMDPAATFALLRRLGGTPGRVLLVACEPACLDEGLGLSPPVAAAVEEAAALVTRLAGEEVAPGPPGPAPAGGPSRARR